MPIRKSHLISIVIMMALLVTSGCSSNGNRSGSTNSTPAGNAANNGSSTVKEPAPDAANSATDSSTGNGTTTDGQNDPDKNNQPADDKGTNATTTPSENTTAPEPDSNATTDPQPVKKLYKMNKVYSFVPIDKATTSNKVVLLTFDDGPKEDKMVSALLDTLDKHKAKAIFFVNGYRVKKHPELLKKIADRGQTIGNHSWDHIDLKKESQASVKKQIEDVQQIVKEVVGTEPQFFRPPFGNGNDYVKGLVRDHGMLYMTWSNGSLDWDSSTKDKPDKVIANVLEQLHPGVNILMHELPWTTEALDTLLTKLESKGYGFIDPATIDLGLEEQTQTAK
ncbi:polysaccharide deacetylase family protein [Paenibacillus lignilyticus]|uniref:Polysaccharide deacetylase family protein n=1 Tax=Paenibacillus lignilyticus TaxID=1172615 RepID=A0ABS5CF09_9BACL|nr:polysaccharide deacetylase family protein [Paenibacillus lignilyticus]MBP3964438.1 polysaccharide deacetylase family protein [Paenibacillus lignilyticus]